jgi:hypothetical protein
MATDSISINDRREKKRERNREYYEANLEKERERSRRYYYANWEKIRERRWEYLCANRKRLNEAQRIRRIRRIRIRAQNQLLMEIKDSLASPEAQGLLEEARSSGKPNAINPR